MKTQHVVVVGAGMGGLAAAIDLASRGLRVTVLERSPSPGGKMREIAVGGARLDAGPTVFTMRWVFEELFADAGASLGESLRLRAAEVLARHTWGDGAPFDLFADAARSTEAVGDLAGAAEAKRFVAFCARARGIWQALEGPFIRGQRPSPGELVRRSGLSGLAGLARISPFTLLWKALGEHFHDPRLRQLFGRYATYCGSSPFLAPATLMLVAHVEQEGVWMVEGGMHQIARAMADLATAKGATFRYSTTAESVVVENGKVGGLILQGGERLAADIVLINGDAAALAARCFGPQVAAAVPPVPPTARSLSAVTWGLLAEAEGFPLLRHSVFFGNDYPGEFRDIFTNGRLPSSPTVYVCAQDRGDKAPTASQSGSRPERLLVLVNAPARGDLSFPDALELDTCTARTFAFLERCGLTLRRTPEATRVTTPADFNSLFPATGGALYGRASHGWSATFDRPGAKTAMPGLYLAGGSVHPGPGVPMAALSGRLAAQAVLADLTSRGR
ncbi:CrtD protein [Rhodospirillum rubrum]|uniref:1-hydroxycarotenoid 3,4-desaturase CrtD n=1 Tax=Rhodospirillum rubrum TaxID=1085 RepID=UPI001906825E|nr:1-hydroxycarotenoid 3,4-desaturase CrtD [Rhodospirillum rubrum]MBK1665788.1 CrtD protein [Rhodospirillum rubrum]MBK1677871.1 CrtD protein [Rhodospirillum rubrum]